MIGSASPTRPDASPPSSAPPNVLAAAQDWRRSGRGVAIATVVDTWGSAPVPAGSQVVVDDKGEFLGSVSGGCVEGEVIMAAEEVIKTGKPQLLEFGVSDDIAWRVGLPCGGKIRVFVEKLG